MTTPTTNLIFKERTLYKGYCIKPHARRRNNGRWNTYLTIQKVFESALDEWQRSNSSTFETRDEAVQSCIRYAYEVIDGKVPNAALISRATALPAESY